MIRNISILMVALFICLMFVGNTYADSFGKEITISDRMIYTGSSTGNPTWDQWWSNKSEDQEVEPWCVTAQVWDLEGFFLKGGVLTMIGGYNFRDGVEGFGGGDIFIDTSNPLDAKYGDLVSSGSWGNDPYKNVFGYDYAIKLNFGATNTYSVYSLTPDSILSRVYYQQNNGSNPWKYDVPSRVVPVATGSFDYLSLTDAGLSGYGINFLGGNHNVVTGIDLETFMPSGTNFISHYTMQCGNDDLMGSGTVAPEPTTLVLLGAGLIGLIGFRKAFKK